MDPVQKNFMIAAAAFIFVSCMAVTAILGISYYFQPPASGNGLPSPTVPGINGLVIPNGTYNNSYTTEILANVSSNGSNMTQDEIVAARDKIKEENAIPLFVVKTKYGLSDDEINGAIDSYLTGGRENALNYIQNLSEKHPDIQELIVQYNESGGDMSIIFGQ